MKVVLQRVKEAYVEVNKDKIASISKGLLVFWGIEKGDSFQDAEVLIEKILKLRIFSEYVFFLLMKFIFSELLHFPTLAIDKFFIIF